MRTATILATVLPLVLAHGIGMDARAQAHRHMERQGLIGGILDPDASSSAAAATTSSARVTSSSREVIPVGPTSEAQTISRSSAVTPTRSASSASVTSGSVTGSLSGSISGSGTASISGSANITASASSNSTTSAPSASASHNVTTTVDQDGITKIVTITYTPSIIPAVQSSSSSASASASSTISEGSSISTGAIIGISVAIGAVVLSLVGCAIWRMKRRGSDEDEAIRWPELNRHGDSDAHHALPARATGGHGIETSPLERSLSNSSDVYMSQHSSGPVTVPMALNGSNFGAASTLDYQSSYDKDLPSTHTANQNGYQGYDYNNYGYPSQDAAYSTTNLATTTAGMGPDSSHGSHGQGGVGSQAYDHDDYSSFPPPVGNQVSPSQGGAGAGLYESDSEGDHGRRDVPTGHPPGYRL